MGADATVPGGLGLFTCQPDSSYKVTGSRLVPLATLYRALLQGVEWLLWTDWFREDKCETGANAMFRIGMSQDYREIICRFMALFIAQRQASAYLPPGKLFCLNVGNTIALGDMEMALALRSWPL